IVRKRPPGSGERSLPYLAGLDGVRAVAVVAVLAFHLSPSAVPGGFLGVSLFFTLSGYLITHLLLAEVGRSRHVDLGAFWERRFRRLLPAALAGLALAAVVGAVQHGPSTLGGDIRAQLVYVLN